MKTQITYHEENGYFYPNLALPEQTHYPIGKYGDLHLSYLKAHKKATYVTLLTTCKLNEYLHEIDQQAHEMVRDIIAFFSSEEGMAEFEAWKKEQEEQKKEKENKTA